MKTFQKHITLLFTICLFSACSETKQETKTIEKSEARLERISYQSDATGKERDYYVYLPEGYDQKEKWPVMLFLHGNGERGDAKEQLDYVFIHGPIFEAWVQKKKLPFVLLVPQLPIFSQGKYGFISNRTKAIIPYPKAEGLQPYRPNYSGEELMNGTLSDNEMPYGIEGQEDGWNTIENELLKQIRQNLAL